MPCYFPLLMALAQVTARFYCVNGGHRSEALTGRIHVDVGLGFANSVFPRSDQGLDRFYLLGSGRLQAKSTPPAPIRTYCRPSSS